jgi:ATP/maltotriose-dependent transcriptional regulator MalT
MEAERYALLNLATDALYVGEIEQAEAQLQEVAQLIDRVQYGRFRYLNRYQLVRAEIALARHAPTEARRWVEEARALAVSYGSQKNIAKSWLIEGRALLAIGDFANAANRLHRAVALADTMAHGSLRWQGRLWLGHACSSRREPVAIEIYREGLQLTEAIARGLADDRLRTCFLDSPLVRELRDRAAGIEPDGGKPDYPAGLTNREVDVLRLVAQGATNQSIAQALYISVKTVNTHLSSILGKVGASNRAGATAFAIRNGLV